MPLDFFAQRYGDSRGVRFWAWLSNVPSLLGIFIAQMLACGSILEGFGIPFRWGVVLCAGVILVYCTIGGMWGVVLTDVIQTGIIMVGVPILAVAILIQYTKAGGSVGEIFATPFIPEGMGTQFIYLVLPFLLSISVSYDAYARIQSAKNAKTAAHGMYHRRYYRHRRGNPVFHDRCGGQTAVPGRYRRNFHDCDYGNSAACAGGNRHRSDSVGCHVQRKLRDSVSGFLFFQRSV